MTLDHDDSWDAADFDRFFLLAILLYAVLAVAFAWDLVATYVFTETPRPFYELPGPRA